LNALLCTFLDARVHALCITSETSVRIQKSKVVGKNSFAELCVTSLLGLTNCAIEYFDPVSVKNLYAAICPFTWQISFIIKVPVFILKITQAFAHAGLTFCVCFFLFASAAVLAIIVVFYYSIRKFRILCGVY
jgi:hypothetical protein